MQTVQWALYRHRKELFYLVYNRLFLAYIHYYRHLLRWLIQDDLNYLFDKFENKKTALSAYNAGEGRVFTWLLNADYSTDGKGLNDIPFKETKLYVNKVLSRLEMYKLLYKF